MGMYKEKGRAFALGYIKESHISEVETILNKFNNAEKSPVRYHLTTIDSSAAPFKKSKVVKYLKEKTHANCALEAAIPDKSNTQVAKELLKKFNDIYAAILDKSPESFLDADNGGKNTSTQFKICYAGNNGKPNYLYMGEKNKNSVPKSHSLTSSGLKKVKDKKDKNPVPKSYPFNSLDLS